MTLILPQPTDTTKSKSHSKLHRVFAIDSGASDQTVVANANNSITVNSTILANYFVGSLVGNASTVTNGIYKNTNNTFTANNTFTISPIVPDATANNQAVSYGQILGVGQTWQDVHSSRSSGVTYYNTTGKPIMVVIGCPDTAGGSARITVVVGGVTILNDLFYDYAANQGAMAATFIVPTSNSYVVTYSGFTPQWSELR